MSRPWFPFYVGDYVKDTARLTTEAHGAYLLLMLDYWTQGAPPDDDEVLATITKLPVKTWRAKVRPLLAGFFQITDGRWRHRRIEDEIARSQEVSTSNSDKARRAARKRWSKDKPKESSEDAPSINDAVPQNAQSQSQPQIQAVVDKQQQLDAPAVVGKSTWRQEDFDLSDRVMEAMGLHKHDTQCVGTAYFCKKWIDAGWQPDLIVDTVKRIMARRSKPPGSVKYFEQAIADAHAELARPLPAGSARSTGPPRGESFADLALEFEQRIKYREQHQSDDDYDGPTIEGTVDG